MSPAVLTLLILAVSIVLFLIILVITMIQMKFQNRWVFQEEE
mgnify:CR=1 FL=1